MTSYQYRKSHCGDKTILRPSYLHNGISYTGKMTSLYWIRAQHTSFGNGSPAPFHCLSTFPWVWQHISFFGLIQVIQAYLYVNELSTYGLGGGGGATPRRSTLSAHKHPGNLTIVTCHVTGIVATAIDVNSRERCGSNWWCQALIFKIERFDKTMGPWEIHCSLATTRELCHKQLQGPQSLFLTGSVIRIGVNGSQNISVQIHCCKKCN